MFWWNLLLLDVFFVCFFLGSSSIDAGPSLVDFLLFLLS